MISLLKRVQLFSGLSEDELDQLASICSKQNAAPRDLVVEQNTTGDEIYIIGEGAIDVFVSGLDDERTLVVLGKGQVFGEMALIDQGYRSASGRAGQSGCEMYVIKYGDFNRLCEENAHIGYRVMRNLALDLAFKLRHRNLTTL